MWWGRLIFFFPTHTELNATYVEGVWIVSVLMVCFGGTTVTLGRIGDKLGQRTVYLVGLVLWIVGSAIGCAATTPNELMAARATLGVAVGAFYPLNLALLLRLFEDRHKGEVIGIWAAVSALGLSIGPTAGAFLTEYATWGGGWRWLYTINFPLTALAIALTLMYIEPDRPNKNKTLPASLDPAGNVLYMIFMASLMLLISSSDDMSPEVFYILLSSCSASFVLFMVVQTTVSNPMIDLTLFTHGNFCGGMVVSFVVVFVLYAILLKQSYYMQKVCRELHIWSTYMLTVGCCRSGGSLLSKLGVVCCQ